MDKDKIMKFVSTMEPFDLVYIFMHDYPDPDAMGAGLCVKRILKSLGKESLLMGMGVSHPQNKVMVNQLNISLINPFEHQFEHDIDKGFKTGTVFVDFHPDTENNNFEFGQTHSVNPNWVIDHHLDKSVDPNWDIQSVGSCCTLALDYLQQLGIEISHDNPLDAELATAMLVGVMTDTKSLLRKGITPRDDEAFKFLRGYYSDESLQEILNYRYPDYFYSTEVIANNNKFKEGSLVILNVGYIPDTRRDVIPYIADHWQRHVDVSMVVVFGLVNSAVSTSVRTNNNAPIRARDLVRKLFLTGGGHPDMAGARVTVPKFWEGGLSNPAHRDLFLQFTMHNIIERAKLIADLGE